jgi:aminoglycoside phosphotransferase (APT) family kinase protein
LARGEAVDGAHDGWLVTARMATVTRPLLRWAAQQVGAGASVVAVKGLKGGGHPWRLSIRHGGHTTQAVLRVGDPARPEWLAAEAAALAVAGDHGLPAPRLLGVDLAGAAGVPALLTSLLPGSSRIPEQASRARLRALGGLAAALAAVALQPGPELPLRLRPLAGADFAADRRARGGSALLAAAEARLGALPAPAGPSVLVHGDLWHGNALWAGDALVGLVDWDQAGAGHPGVDLGWQRYDAALLFGPAAAAEVLAGWREAAGRDPEAVAYWDVVAALATPADLADWLPVFGRQGRSDLDAATLWGRHEAFLRAALDQLGRG